MDEIEFGTEQDLMESIQSSLQDNFGVESPESSKKEKKDSLQEMKKTLPEWSLEPPETFLP